MVSELPLGDLVTTLYREGVISMITYTELFQLGTLIVALIALCLKHRDK